MAAAEVERQVVEEIRKIARDPVLIAETVRQARRQRDEIVVRLKAEERSLRRELRGKRASLKRVGAKCDDTTAHRERIAAIAARLDALPGEIRAAERAWIDEAEVRSALGAFGALWDALLPAERARIVHMLVEAVAYTGRGNVVAIRFRRNGFCGLAAFPEE